MLKILAPCRGGSETAAAGCQLARLLLLITISLGGGCSMLSERSQRDPSERTVFCALEYQPGVEGDNLRFLAGTMPYRYETFHMSLPDVLFHRLFAPRRHLIVDAVVEGAVCAAGVWPKGYRLPTTFKPTHTMICQRQGDQEVRFEVTTRSGSCVQRIPVGDKMPRDIHALRSAIGLPPLQ